MVTDQITLKEYKSINSAAKFKIHYLIFCFMTVHLDLQNYLRY